MDGEYYISCQMTINETEAKESFFLNIKSILVKSVATAAITVSGLLALGSKSNHAQAAVVNNDAQVVTVNYQKALSIRVWNNYENPVATGQRLAYGTSWKVIKTAYDHNGQKWYDLGKNQWVMAKYTNHADGQNVTVKTKAASQNTSAAAAASSTATTSYASASANTGAASGSEASAKAWIAARESGGSYSARNGQYIGKYQLSASYLNGNYSAANQERVANNYVKSRYGSWQAAKSFWQSHGWY